MFWLMKAPVGGELVGVGGPLVHEPEAVNYAGKLLELNGFEDVEPVVVRHHDVRSPVGEDRIVAAEGVQLE
jgi:hypothetical protein